MFEGTVQSVLMVQVAVELVVAPSSIDITVADIGGLDEILELLVSCFVKEANFLLTVRTSMECDTYFAFDISCTLAPFHAKSPPDNFTWC